MDKTVLDFWQATDALLITSVRAGDNAAFGILFERHRIAATGLARHLLPGPDADDLVSEAFTKVLIKLQEGQGPNLAFRAYLLTVIRRLHIDRIRATRRVHVTSDVSELDATIAFVDHASLRFEKSAAAQAFGSLSQRWQLVLWRLDVEGRKPADIAPLLAMTPNSVSALAYRAREGLRQAYLQQHLTTEVDEDCSWTTTRLAAHVRKGLSNREVRTLEEHLSRCRRCAVLHLELAEVNAHLGPLPIFRSPPAR